jgi:hypothetical protein
VSGELRRFVLAAILVVVFMMPVIHGMRFPYPYSGYVWRRVSGNIGLLSYPVVFIDSGKPYIVGVNGSNLVLFDVENLMVRVLTVCPSPVTVVAANGGAYAICSTYLFGIDKNGYVNIKNYETVPSFAVFNHYNNELAVFIRQTVSTVVDVVGKGSYTLSNVHVYSAGFVNGYWYLLYKNLVNNFWYIGKYDSSFNLVVSTSLDYTPYTSIPDAFAVNERAIVVVGEMESGFTNIYLHNLTLETFNVEMVGGYVNVVAATANYHIVLVNTTGYYRGIIHIWYVNDIGELYMGPADIRYLLSLGSASMEYVLRLGLIDSYMYLNDYITGLHADSRGNWYLTLYGVTLATTTTVTSTVATTDTVTMISTVATTDTVTMINTSTVTAALPVYYTRTKTVTTTVTAAGFPEINVVVVVIVLVVLLLLALYYLFRRVR